MPEWNKIKQGMLESLMVLIDQKISYYQREQCNCQPGKAKDETERYLEELNTGRKQLELLAVDEKALAASANETGDGSLVLLETKTEEDEVAPLLVFLVPYGGGQVLEMEGENYMTVTTDSDLGKALLVTEKGGEGELDLGDRKRAFTVLQVN